MAASLLSSRVADASATLAAVGDPTATRTVYVTVVILLVLGVAMALLAVWVFRRTRPEPELLAPLEAMESRNWRRVDPATQRRLLDDARPAGAAPLKRQASVPKLDSEFATVAPVASFDDLVDDEPGDDVVSNALVDDDLEFAEDGGLPDPTPVGGQAQDSDALEIDDPVAAAHRPEAEAFDDDLDFGDAAPPGTGNGGFADDFAHEFGDDPLIARQRSSDGDRT